MKSFTRSPADPAGMRADKRLEVLAKKQEAEHQHLMESYRKEMQELRDFLNLSMERFTSISNRNEQHLAQLQTESDHGITLLKDRVVWNETVLLGQKKSIEDLHERLLEIQTLYSSLHDLDKIKKEMEAQIRETTFSHLISLQDLQRELKSLFSSLRDDFSQFKWDVEKKFCELIDSIEKNFNVTKIDREGVLKEIRIYEKTIFVIEKKIENIYTLIERINKKGELCHKPE